MTSIPDLSQLDPNDNAKRQLIARPDLRPGVLLPPVVPPPSSTQVGSTQSMPDPAPPAIASPDMSATQSRVNFLRSSPSGISQLHPKSTIGKVGKGLLQAGDVIGSIAAPGLMANIPGTTMHHNFLEAQAERQLGSDVANQQKQAQAGAVASEAQTAQQKEAETERHNRADEKNAADKLNAPTPAKAPHITYDSGIPVSVSDGHGNVYDVNDPHLPPELKPLVDAANRAHGQRVSEQQQAEDRRAQTAQDSQNRVFAHQEELERQRETHGEQQAQQRQTSQVQAANQKEATNIHGALDFADNYLKDEKNWSGSGDDALQFQYFELARPQTGFRMNQAEIQRQNQARSWREGMEARARHAAFGTWFSPEQRKQIVQSMHELATAKLNAMKHGGQQQPTDNDPLNIR